jgi:Type ISP C-terminal specificity domain
MICLMPGRTWIIAPDNETLEKRWAKLVAESDPGKKELLFHPHLRNKKPGDKHVRKSLAEALVGHEERLEPVLDDKKPAIKPERYAFRSFDRQWIIPDGRLINQSNPTLWKAYSSRQIHITAPEDRTPTVGPALTLTALIPDLHHYHGRGGRVYPLWRDRDSSLPNIKPALLAHLAKVFALSVKAEDLMAYFAAIMAHPAFTARFKADLLRPGLRVPLTADAKLFAEAVKLGSEVIWLHCYGERLADEKAERPKGPPRLPKETAPFIPAEGAIPRRTRTAARHHGLRPSNAAAESRQGLRQERHTRNVGLRSLWQAGALGMFSDRRSNRSKPVIGDKRPPSPLDKIQPDHWLPEHTSDLLDLLHVLGRLIALEPKQAHLLERICSGPVYKSDELREAGALTHDEQKPIKAQRKSKIEA